MVRVQGFGGLGVVVSGVFMYRDCVRGYMDISGDFE